MPTCTSIREKLELFGSIFLTIWVRFCFHFQIVLSIWTHISFIAKLLGPSLNRETQKWITYQYSAMFTDKERACMIYQLYDPQSGNLC